MRISLVISYKVTPQTLPQPITSKHQPSIWSKVVAAREFGSLAALVIMIMVIAVSIPQFAQWENIVNITVDVVAAGNVDQFVKK